jgi:integrase
MPKRAKELTPAAVRKISEPGLHAVGGVAGLYLQVTQAGGKTWVLRTMVGRKRRDIGLGGFGTVTLAQAREKAREYHEMIRAGRDPVAERQAAKQALIASQTASLTFDDAVAQYLKNKRQEFKNPKHIQQWENTLKQYASPVIGNLSVDQIELAHVVKVLEPIWNEKTETASRLRGRIEHVLNYATVRGYRKGDNPARWKGNLDAVLAKPSKVKGGQHFKALPFAEMPQFMADLRQRKGLSARALEFTILTAARSGEVRGATWAEFDLENKLWVIPAERMKAGKEHRVPLTDGAVKLLESLPRMDGTDLVFPSSTNTKLSDMSLTAVLRRMGRDVTVHGFRSTFRDWTAERTAYANEVIEKCLAHAIGDKVEAAYRRGDLLAKRRRLMADWEKFCNGEGDAASAEVVNMAEAR